MSSDNQEGEFTEVHRKCKKRKTASSPTLPPSTLQRTRSSELPPETPTRPKTSTLKNQIPVILSNIDKKFQTWRQVMGELRQHHPSLRISKVKALQKGDLLVVGDSPQDAVILQSESKMKAALGKNIRVSLPKAYQITKQQNKCLVVKGVPTDLKIKFYMPRLNAIKAKKTAGSCQCFNSKLVTLSKPRLSFLKI